MLRTGKRLPRRTTEVTIVLRESERRLFDDAGIARLPAHHLALRIQPDEGISMVFRAKEPGPGMALDVVPMDFSYVASFSRAGRKPTNASSTARWLAIRRSSCARTASSARGRSWLRCFDVRDSVHPDAAGTWGPRAADDLIAPRVWRAS